MVTQITNEMYLDQIRLLGTDASRQLIPSAEQNGVGGFLDAFYTDPAHTHPNNAAFDEFSGLFARFAAEIGIHTYQWNSPFEQFVSPLPTGDGKVMTALDTPEVNSFDAHKSDLLVRDFGNPHTRFAPMNFNAKKTISISENNLRTAILQPGQLSSYANAQFDTLYNADMIATFVRMKRTLADAVRSRDFANAQVVFADPQHPTSEELVTFSEQLREFVDYMTIRPSADFNAVGVTTISIPDDIVIFLNPIVRENMVVRVLADAFHREDREIQQRVILLDELPYDCHCVVGDRKMLNEFRQIRTINSMPFDQSTQSFNLTLVHKAAMAYDPFVNALAISNSAPTIRQHITVVPPTGIKATVVNALGNPITEYDPKSYDRVHLEVEPVGGSVDPLHRRVHVPRGHDVVVSCADDPKAVNASTYVDKRGLLHLQRRIKTGITLTFTVTSDANDNPDSSIDDAAKLQPLTTTATLKLTDKSNPTPPVTPTVSKLTITGPASGFVGKVVQLQALATYSDDTVKDVTGQVVWAADASGVLDVSKTGAVTIKTEGTGYVTAKYSGVAAQMFVVQGRAPRATSLAIGGTLTVGVDKTTQLTGTLTFDDGSTKVVGDSLTWATGDKTIATVGLNTGLVTGVKVGKTAVSVKYIDKTGVQPDVIAPPATIEVTA